MSILGIAHVLDVDQVTSSNPSIIRQPSNAVDAILSTKPYASKPKSFLLSCVMDQAAFHSKYLELDLYPAVQGEGRIREQGESHDQTQRVVITDRSPGSPYKVQAILRSCIHGQWTTGSNRPTSLIVVDYMLVILKEDARFSSMYTEFEFSDCAKDMTSRPAIRAYAPFRETARFDVSTADQKSTHGAEVSAGPEIAGIKILDGTLKREVETSWSQKYFGQGNAGIEYCASDQRPHCVWWYMIQNSSQQAGIPAKFRVAMLVERESCAKFMAKFDITAKGGIGYMIANLRNKFTRKTSIRNPIIFDPTADPLGNDLEGPDGTVIAIDRNELGSLAKNKRLFGLARVEGCSPLVP